MTASEKHPLATLQPAPVADRSDSHTPKRRKPEPRITVTPELQATRDAQAAAFKRALLSVSKGAGSERAVAQAMGVSKAMIEKYKAGLASIPMDRAEKLPTTIRASFFDQVVHGFGRQPVPQRRSHTEHACDLSAEVGDFARLHPDAPAAAVRKEIADIRRAADNAEADLNARESDARTFTK